MFNSCPQSLALREADLAGSLRGDEAPLFLYSLLSFEGIDAKEESKRGEASLIKYFPPLL